MDTLLLQYARKVPARIRKHIIEENFVDLAVNTETRNTPMEYLFDVYAEFLDATGEFDNWFCPKCREHILFEWRRIKPFLIQIQNEHNGT